ncbi:MAG: cobaltochelatase subunit CobN, partial [Opitutales bacterium]
MASLAGAASQPVGVFPIPLHGSADTYISIPLERGPLAIAPVLSAQDARITLPSGAVRTLEEAPLGTYHYVVFRSGALAGHCEGCERQCEFKSSATGARDMNVCRERAETLARRVAKMVRLRRTERAKRRVAITLFNFPPNAGATGTAAFLSVFESLHRTLGALQAAGYDVEVPQSVDALRDRVLGGNAEMLGQDANVHARVSAETHVRRERWLRQIEAAWGPAPGRALSDGRDIFILGERFGNVFVGVQPSFGYEGDPMRLL